MRLVLFCSFLAIGVAISLTLGGCNAMEERPVKVGIETRSITLERTYSATEDCSRNAQPTPGWKIIACATYTDSWCRIRMQPTASDDTLGHEARHCFDGAWHR